MNRILLIDLAERELEARARLSARADYLETIENTKATSGGLSTEQQEELKRLLALLDSDVTVDTFYQTVASQVARKTWEELVAEPLYVLKYGLFGSQQVARVIEDLQVHEREIAAVCGLLQLDHNTDPRQSRF